MAMAVKIPKRMSLEDISEVLGEKGMQRFMQRWAVHRVGFQNVPMLTIEGIELALEVLEGKRSAKSPEHSAIAALALNYWVAVPHAKIRLLTWARMTHDKFQQERDSVKVNGQKPRRRRRGK